MNAANQSQLDLLIVAADFGDHRSAATSRYGALISAARELGLEVGAANAIDSNTGEDIRAGFHRRRANIYPLHVRTLREVADGIKMATRLPKATLILVGIPSVFSGLLVASYLKLRRQRYWIDVRDIYPDVLVSAGVAKPHSLSSRLLGKWLCWVYAGAEKIIATTDSIAQRLKQRTTREVVTVRNGYGDRFSQLAATSATPTVIATHGTLGRFQNTALLARVILEARRQQLPWQFIVVGDGPTGHHLTQAAGPTLQWIRSASQEEMPLLLKNASLGLSLRTSEDISAGSIPVRMLEYLGLGIPVLVCPSSEGGAALASLGVVEQTDANEEGEIVAHMQAMLQPERYAKLRACAVSARPKFRATKQWERILSDTFPRPRDFSRSVATD